MKRITAITGGIGAGKSVVCHVVSAMGYPVYDCDSRARMLMDADCDMKRRISAEITPEAIDSDGKVNRACLAHCVFSNQSKLRRLNDIVHGAVRGDFARWADSQSSDRVFVETAILYESGFDSLVGEVWEVTAPLEERISRVQRRSGFSREEVESRIAAQTGEEAHPSHLLIENDGVTPLLPQIMKLL